MLIITLRTDKPEAELGLYQNAQQLAYINWPADRQLAETIHQRLTELLKSQGQALTSLQGIVVFEGPGSFTGLRIGISVANALAYAFTIPIVACGGENWIGRGLELLKQGHNQTLALPHYGALPNVTPPKK